MSKMWSDVEKEYATLLKRKEWEEKHKRLLNSVYGCNNVIPMDEYVDTDTVSKTINKKWRTLKVMSELEKNSFVKMFNEGWCSTCNFDSSKCAEQHECEAFKTVNNAINKGGDDK